jgi:hypothetical protein
MVLLLLTGVFFVELPTSDVLLASRCFILGGVLGALRPSLLAVRAMFLARAGLGTPSRALAAFAQTLSLVALDVESGVADDLGQRWFRRRNCCRCRPAV